MLKKSLFFVLLIMLFLLPPLYQADMAYGQTTTRELVSNNNFRGLQGWTIQEWFNPTGRRGEVSEEPDGLKFRSTSGNTRMGVMQTINADVSGAQQLNLTAVVKAVNQTLDGTGWQGREAPIAVMVSYTDINGVIHNALPIMPNESQTNRMFWHGFYYKDPTGNSRNWHGTKIPQNQFYTFRYNLMSLNPRPKIIHAVGAEGSGWSPREGKINMISLQYVGTPTPPPPQAGSITSFTWVGMDEDKVGQWGRGTPDGTKDGHFNLRISNPPNGVEITSIAVYSANEGGAPAGGQIWHTANTSNWVLGVFQQGRQINPSHVRTLGVFRGDTVFDLYCNDSGWFKPNQNFLVEVIFAGGAKATRVVRLPAAPPPPPPPQAGSITSFTWVGMDEDKVGQWGRGTPDGTKDGHFNLRISNPPNGVEITSIAVYSANESGAPAGGQIWHTANTSNWVLGVFQQGRQINPSHVRTLGVFRGDTVFDLYCNDSGWFKPNQNFLVEVIFAGGAKATRVVKLPAIQPPPPPPPPQALNLSGAWNCNEGGKYYIRQLGNRIWWFGELSPTNPSWSNVAYGTLTGNELRLEWADVPKGSIMGTGTLILQVISNNRIEAKQKTGGFGCSTWTR